MQTLPRILVAGYPGLTDNYCLALRGVGLEAVVTLSTDRSIVGYSGLLLPGGSDIEPSLFHQTNKGSMNIDFELDRVQLALLSQFALAGKPVLGICKGLQIINVYFGGDVLQDLPTAVLHAWNKADMIHATTASKGSFVEKLYGRHVITNSAHHQGAGVLGEQIQAVQFSEDHVIEAICHTNLPIIALQWHPERMCFQNRRPDTVDGEAIFHYYKALVNQTASL